MRSVIWDMGGTLVDTYPAVDRTLATAVWGDDVTGTRLAEVRTLRVRSIAHAIEVLSQRHHIDPALLQQAYSDLKVGWKVHPAPLMDGAREVLDAVHSGGGLNLVATHRDRASAQTLLDALGITVDDLVCAPDGLPRKPDPTMNLTLVARHRLVLGEVMCVGDRVIDVQAADRAGLASALLVAPGEPAEDLGDLSTTVITHLKELLPLLNGTWGSAAN